MLYSWSSTSLHFPVKIKSDPEDEEIKRIEKKMGKSYYTIKKNIFGYEINLKINPKDEDFFTTLAKRIYSIRCAIVHSKVGYQKEFKYTPSTKNDDFLRMEIPIMRYLSEEVIINSAIKVQIW